VTNLEFWPQFYPWTTKVHLSVLKLFFSAQLYP
jgi:hypothetical protein